MLQTVDSLSNTGRKFLYKKSFLPVYKKCMNKVGRKINSSLLQAREKGKGEKIYEEHSTAKPVP